MTEKITTEKKEMTVTNNDGEELKVMAEVITTDHGIFDEDGNPKISVEVKIPATEMFGTPGENGE